MKKFIEWTEGNVSRGRKVVLFMTIIMFLIITGFIFTIPVVLNTPVPGGVTTLYVTFVGLMTAVYGFYTGTSSEKSNLLEEEATKYMIDRFKQENKERNKDLENMRNNKDQR